MVLAESDRNSEVSHCRSRAKIRYRNRNAMKRHPDAPVIGAKPQFKTCGRVIGTHTLASRDTHVATNP